MVGNKYKDDKIMDQFLPPIKRRCILIEYPDLKKYVDKF